MTASFKIYEKKGESAGAFTQGKWVHDQEHRNEGPNWKIWNVSENTVVMEFHILTGKTELVHKCPVDGNRRLSHLSLENKAKRQTK